jgi:hypothetical protein
MTGFRCGRCAHVYDDETGNPAGDQMICDSCYDRQGCCWSPETGAPE